MSRLGPVVLALLLVGCVKPPPAPVAKAGPPATKSTYVQEPKIDAPEVLPRYIAQIKREFGVIWRRTGRYPEAAESVARMLMWQPGASDPRPLRTLDPDIDISSDRSVIWYSPPDADGIGAHLRYWVPSEQSVDMTVVIDPLEPAFDLAAGREDRFREEVDLASLMRPTGDADGALRALLLAQTPAEAGPAAATYYSFTALMEWVLTLRAGQFPETEADLQGMTLGQPGTLAGLEIYVDREQGRILSRFVLPDLPVWMVETRFQSLADGRWIALSYGIDPATSLEGSLWRVM